MKPAQNESLGSSAVDRLLDVPLDGDVSRISARLSFERQCDESFSTRSLSDVLVSPPSSSRTLSFRQPSLRSRTSSNATITANSTFLQPYNDDAGSPPISITPTPSGKHAASQWRRRLHGWWYWELSGVALSIGCIVAIVAILPRLDNKPLARWNFIMAPNTFISTFITVAKTSMLLAVAEGMSQLKWLYFQEDTRSLARLDTFNDASRGPWGSLRFLMSRKGTKNVFLASLGAIIVFIALAMEPMAQQIVGFETRDVPVFGSHGEIPIAYGYDGRLLGECRFDNPISIHYAKIMNCSCHLDDDIVGLEGAIYNGLYNLDRPDKFLCPTGNCTWPNFSSLGLCSTCKDIMAKVSLSECAVYNSTHKGYDEPTKDVIATYSIEDADDLDTPSLKINDTFVRNGKPPVEWYLVRGPLVKSMIEIGSLKDINMAIHRLNASKLPENGSFQCQPRLLDSHVCHFRWCAKRHHDVSVVSR